MHTKLNFDELEKFSEKELRQILRKLQSEAYNLRKGNMPQTVKAEVEICYVQRELELRSRYSRFNKPEPRNSNTNDQIEFETAV